jgi:hypothetical protein
MQLRRLAATALAAAAAGSGLAACNGQQDEHVRVAETEGVYVSAGELKYQVQISRVLNPFDAEDKDYLRGIAPVDRVLPRNSDWFGVFIRVFNQSQAPHLAARSFVIRDTTGKTFRPIPLDISANAVAYVPQAVAPAEQLPVANTLARTNTTQGGLLLFKIPSNSFANRPLEFFINDPAGGLPARVALDV